MPNNYTILSCDGGGIRGLLTAMILNGLPDYLVPNTQLFAGTSTGGILSIGMAAGIPLSELVDLYAGHCPNIFAQSPASTDEEIRHYLHHLTGSWIEADAIWALVEAGYLKKTLFSAKWANKSLYSQLLQTLGDKAFTSFADLRGQDINLLVTTFQMANASNQWTPITIDNLGSSSDSTLIDAAMATSAAPTYFPPYNHPTFGYCIDGGVFANNPSTFALARALQYDIDINRIYILSVGTGATIDGVPASYFDHTVPPQLWGIYQYMFPINPRPESIADGALIDLMMDGSSETDDEQTAAMLPEGHYLRIEVPLKSPITLDDCKQVSTLQDIAKHFMQGPEWPSFVSWVEHNWG